MLYCIILNYAKLRTYIRDTNIIFHACICLIGGSSYMSLLGVGQRILLQMSCGGLTLSGNCQKASAIRRAHFLGPPVER